MKNRALLHMTIHEYYQACLYTCLKLHVELCAMRFKLAMHSI